MPDCCCRRRSTTRRSCWWTTGSHPARSAEQAGLTPGAPTRDERDGIWPQGALEAALCIAAGADLTRLTEWIAVGQERAALVR